jgi:hypothetical protein
MHGIMNIDAALLEKENNTIPILFLNIDSSIVLK